MNDELLVIDACVALKWRLRDEEDTAQADALLDECAHGRFMLLAPTLFDYEIANALKVAVDMKRLTGDEAAKALADLQVLDIKRVDFATLQTRAFQLACEFGRSVYDAAYLALAESQDISFYTGDRKLFNAMRSRVSWVQWIGDFST